MYNKGRIGRRTNDFEGLTKLPQHFYETQTPSPTIQSYDVCELGTYVPLDDVALDLGGNQTIVIRGAGFSPNATVQLDGTTINTVTFLDPTRLAFTSIAKASGTYSLLVNNGNGRAALLVPGIVYSGVPTFVSPAAGSIGSFYETNSINETISATSDSAVTYAISAGTLPSGVTLSSAGVLSGTSPVDSGITTYSFTVKATDQEGQDSFRSYSLTINTDVVTWSNPANNSNYELQQTIPIDSITLLATSAAGKSVTYSADVLPSGISLSGDTISGTPTVLESVSTTLTATANITNRSATRNISWVVSLPGDPFFRVTSLLLSGYKSSSFWIQDSSTNKFTLTYTDARPSAFSPYETQYSAYLDGVDDYIGFPNGTAVQFGTGHFTIECFVFRDPSGPAYPVIFTNTSGDGGSSGEFTCYMVHPAGNNMMYGAGGLYKSGGTAPPANKWSHYALCRDGTSLRVYVDGVRQWEETTGSFFTSSYGLASGTFTIGVRTGNVAQTSTKGYISNFRVTKNECLYTGASFVVPTSKLTAGSNTTVLALQSNRFLDTSVNALAVTGYNGTLISNFGKFEETDLITGSGYFDGSADVITVPGNSAFDFGSGNFTLECWIYPNTTAGTLCILDAWNNAPTRFLLRISSGQLQFYANPGTSININHTLPGASTWYHVACVRNGSNFSLYVNGVSVGTPVTNAGTIASSVANWTISRGAETFNGYISNVRIVKGTAVYTTNFTPPTQPLTAITNTSLLTLQNRASDTNTRVLDSSGLDHTVTRFGNATQGARSPFSLTGWSNYFDGTGDFLSLSSSALTIGTSDFTLEFWIYVELASLPTNATIYDQRAGTNGASVIQPVIELTNVNGYAWYIAAANRITSGTSAVLLNTWQHIAVSRTSNVTKMFIDGVQVGSNYSDTNNYPAGALNIGKSNDGVTQRNHTGYISNLRLVVGTGLYTTNFTPSTTPLEVITNTRLLTCQSNKIIDSSPYNISITRNADVSVQKFNPFAPVRITPKSYSAYFDGTGDYVDISNVDTAFGASANFTIEFWMYPTIINSVVKAIIDPRTSDASAHPLIWIDASNRLYYFTTNVTRITGTTTLTANQWYHVAVVRNDGTTRLYLNGVEEGTPWADTVDYVSSTTFRIGQRYASTAFNYGGYLSNLRVVKGTAVYTSNFTPPTVPLTAIANTSLLTCQSSRFIDNSTNNFTITANGDAAPRTFNPFGNNISYNVEYSVSTVGGSFSFDGTGDYLDLPSNAAFTLGTLDFTIEGYLYLISGTTGTLYDSRTGTTTLSPVIYLNSGVLTYFVGANRITGPTLVAGQWHHIAVARSGSSTKLFLNGVQVGSTYTDTNNYVIGPPKIGAGYTNTNLLNGYISNLRVLKGTALYTSNFVPPIAPLTAIPYTVALLNGTHSGIVDHTSNNNIEILNNTRLVSNITKYNNTSLLFDGTDDAAVMPSNIVLDFGTGDFTIELWVYFNALTSNRIILDRWITGNANSWQLYWRSTGTSLTFLVGSATVLLQDSNASRITTGQWYHVAITRASATNRMFIDGVQVASATNSTSLTNALPLSVGMQYSTSTNDFSGYMDDIRITKGYARYTTNFTPPIAALQIK